jgi:SRSO17 transposase
MFLKMVGLSEVFQSTTRNSINTAIDYLMGLLTLTHNRNMSKITENTQCQTTAHSFSDFFNRGAWSSDNLCKILRKFILSQVNLDSVVFTLDESGDGKSGIHSVGAARQYCGNLGKVDLCQVGVYLGIQIGRFRLLIDYRLYLPQSIIDNVENQKKFGIPSEQFVFKRKTDLALEMIDSLLAEGIMIKKIVMDGFYGADAKFLSNLSNRKIIFLADIAHDTKVYIQKPIIYLPLRKGFRGKMPSIMRVLTECISVNSLSSDQLGWVKVFVRSTERGHKIIKMKCFRVWRRENNLPVSDPLWLIISYDEHEKKLKYSFSNMPESSSEKDLADFQSSRYWIERAFEDAKSLYGLNEFRGRNWNCWHKHIALVMVCATFIGIKTEELVEQGVAIRITGLLKIFRCANPLKQRDVEEGIELVNRQNSEARRSRFSRVNRLLS